MNIGAQAEIAAARYLRQRGLQLIMQNYRCRFGEIDLILQEGETLVFAEVRFRSSKDFGGAAASIDARKQSKLICTAQHYLSKLAHIPPCRFDAVLLKSPAVRVGIRSFPAQAKEKDLPRDFADADIEWIKNAFGA